jgi:MFS transporter, DHA1 family, inner membrane transport protein
MQKKELTILFTLALVQFTHILDGMIMMPMAPNLKISFDINSQQFSYLVASYGIAAFASAIGATFWMDKFDRKKVLFTLYIGFLLGTFACASAPTYGFLLAARLFTGLFGGVAGAVILSIVGDIIPLERRAQGMGILMSGFALASVAGIPLGIYLSEAFSWHMPFYFICAMGLFVIFAIAFIIPNVNSHMALAQKKSTFDLYKTVFTNSNQVRALLLSITMIFAHFSIIPYITDYFVNNLGFNMKGQIIYMYVVGGILSTFTSPLWGKLADKHGRFKIYCILSLLAIIPIFMISNFQSHSLAALLGTTAMFFIFSGGRMIPSSAMVTSAVAPHQRGGFMSLNSAVQQLAMGLATLIGGLIIVNDEAKKLYNYPVLGYIGIAFTLIAIIVAYGVKPVEIKKPVPSEPLKEKQSV